MGGVSKTSFRRNSNVTRVYRRDEKQNGDGSVGVDVGSVTVRL